MHSSVQHLHLVMLKSIIKSSSFGPNMNWFLVMKSQEWIEEMSSFVKAIDKKHLLTIGLEGFYGPKSPKRSTQNPEFWAADLGTDFIRNSMPSTIDFASVHIYPDHWYMYTYLSMCYF